MKTSKKMLIITISIPNGIDASIQERIITVHGQLGTITKRLCHPLISISRSQAGIQIKAKGNTKREKRILNTFRAHIKNMIHGVKEGYQYKLKVCSSHFPMSISQENDYLIIKNFFGERKPRKAKLLEGTKAIIDGQEIIIKGIDKEAVGQTSANIEKATRRPGFDRRVFQDGIYIYGKEQ